MELMEKFDIIYFEKHYHKGICRIDSDREIVNMYEYDDSYVIQSEPKEKTNFVCSLKIYYPDTLTLKTEGNYLKNGNTEIGVWKTYDEFGAIREEVDYEEEWNTHWEDVQQLLKEDNIDLNEIMNVTRYVNEPEEPIETNKEQNEEEDLENSEDWIGFDENEENGKENEDSSDSITGKLWNVTISTKGMYYLELVYDSDQRKKVFEKLHSFN